MDRAHTHTPRRRPHPPLRLVRRNNAATRHGMVQCTMMRRNKTSDAMLQCNIVRCNILQCNIVHCAMQHSQLGHCAMQQDAIGFAYWLCWHDKYIYWSQKGTKCFFVRWSVFLNWFIKPKEIHHDYAYHWRWLQILPVRRRTRCWFTRRRHSRHVIWYARSICWGDAIMIEKILIACASLGGLIIVIAEVVRSIPWD